MKQLFLFAITAFLSVAGIAGDDSFVSNKKRRGNPLLFFLSGFRPIPEFKCSGLSGWDCAAVSYGYIIHCRYTGAVSL